MRACPRQSSYFVGVPGLGVGLEGEPLRPSRKCCGFGEEGCECDERTGVRVFLRVMTAEKSSPA